MHVDLTPFRCSACGFEYMQETLQNVAPKLWILHMKSLHCPRCGSGYKHLGIRLLPEQPLPALSKCDTL